jgi:hypothetical protein
MPSRTNMVGYLRDLEAYISSLKDVRGERCWWVQQEPPTNGGPSSKRSPMRKDVRFLKAGREGADVAGMEWLEEEEP